MYATSLSVGRSEYAQNEVDLLGGKQPRSELVRVYEPRVARAFSGRLTPELLTHRKHCALTLPVCLVNLVMQRRPNRRSREIRQQESPSLRGKAVSPLVQRTFSPWKIVLLLGAIVSPWLVIVFLLTSRNAVFGNSKSPAVGIATQANDLTHAAALPLAPKTSSNTMPSDPPPQQWTVGEKGPWGQIESLLFALDVPDECVAASTLPPVRWSFPAYSKEKVLATLRTVGLSDAEVNRLKSSAKWSSDEGVTSVEPGDPLILRLAPEIRAKLYAILTDFPQNARQIDPICFRPGNVDWRLQDSGLAPESVALLKRMLYPQGENTLMFADFTPVLRSLSSDAERSRFMKVVSRKQAVLARVRLDPDSDVEKLAQYWGIGGRRKDIFPILNSLHRIDKGFSLSVICLLPEFARNRLYRHPCTVPDDKRRAAGLFLVGL